MQSLVGQSLESAQKELENREYRITRIDDKPFMITCDFRSERLNLQIEKGIIVKVTNG
jgi:hypothetical protein